MAMVRNIKKQDDKYLTALRELVTNGGSGGNRQCFDCGQKGPTYVNMTIGSFVCTRCSGVLRGLTPPHRVKSISMATFTQDEIDFLKAHGNNECAKTWLGLWDPKRAVHQDHRELMIDKYERKRYYLEPASPLKSLTNAASLISNIHGNSTTSKPTTTTTTSSNGIGQIHSTDAAKTKTENGLTNGNKQQQQQQQIHLKPPNGMRKSHSYNNNTNNNTTTNGSKNNDVTAINRVHQMENAFNLKQSANKLLSENNSTTTTTESGFGADTNFVADFGTANIFNATTTAATAPTTNGYAKIQQQSNKIAQQQQQYNTITNNRTSNNNNNNNKNNNKNYQFMNGGQEATTTTTTTQLTNGSNNNENFADFDHAPIYNAAGNNLGINDTNNGHINNVNGNMKYQFVRKTNIRKKPPLYDLQQLALQQKRQNDASEQQQQDKFNDEFVYPTRSTATRSFSIDDIFFTNEIEQQQQQEKQEIINDRNLSANTDTNPFCDKNNSYFSFNEEDPFNHNARTKQPQQQQQFQAKENINMNKQKKFTPLALAAHATAMAVLQKDYHFNNDHNKHVSFSDGFSQQKINKHVFDNNQFNINDDENENENEDDDDWYTGGGLEWRSYTTSTTTNENESPNDTKLKSIIGQQHQLQQTPSKSEYNQNSSTTYDVYNTTWCTNDLHEYNNQYNNNNNNNNNNSNCNFVGFSNNDNNNTLGNIGNGDGNFIYMDKSTTVNSTPSFPISKGIHNTSANNNIDNQRNNGKLNRTPSEDRYAALKDLDEQLRESKSFTDVFATNNMNSNGSINPFKSQHAQQQQQQQQQHIQAPQTAQQQIMANPFQTQPAANYYQAQMNIMPNNPQNMAGMSAQNYYNYNNNNNNRYVMGQHGLGANNMQGPNGCGFGFNTMQQDKMVNAAAEDFNNPFVVNGSMNSNNPFL